MRSVMAAGVLFFLSVAPGKTAPVAVKDASNQQEKKRIQLQLVQTRIQLLRKDPELQELNARIESLQRLLIRKLDSRKSMQALYQQLQKIEQQPKAKRSAKK